MFGQVYFQCSEHLYTIRCDCFLIVILFITHASINFISVYNVHQAWMWSMFVIYVLHLLQKVLNVTWIWVLVTITKIESLVYVFLQYLYQYLIFYYPHCLILIFWHIYCFNKSRSDINLKFDFMSTLDISKVKTINTQYFILCIFGSLSNNLKFWI